MTSVFVSYSPEDKYFADFLVELLRYHQVDVQETPDSSDCLIVALAADAASAPGITREIAAFRTAHPAGPIIPLLLVAEAVADPVDDRAGAIPPIRFHESMLAGFQELLGLLDRTLFPLPERRSGFDRRSAERRQVSRRGGGDRRAGFIDRRMRVGMKKAYGSRTGRGDFEPMNWLLEVSRVAHFLAGSDSPLRSFDFIDRQTGKPAFPDYRTLRDWIYDSAEERTSQRRSSFVYIFDDIITQLTDAYVVLPKERRGAARRIGERRHGERRVPVTGPGGTAVRSS